MRLEEIALFEEAVEVAIAIPVFWVVVFPGPGDGELSGESGSPKRISVAGLDSASDGQTTAPDRQTRINSKLRCPGETFFGPMEAFMAFRPLMQYRQHDRPGERSRGERDPSERRGRTEVRNVGRDGR